MLKLKRVVKGEKIYERHSFGRRCRHTALGKRKKISIKGSI